MKGSIRIIAGLVITLAAAGGLDIATDAQLIPCIIFVFIGAYTMYSGIKAMNEFN